MNSFCPYHQLTNKKSKQRIGCETVNRSSSRKSNTVLQTYKHYTEQQFNDYNLEPPKQNQKDRKINKIGFKSQHEKQSINNRHNKKITLHNSRCQQSFARSLKDQKQKTICQKSQNQLKGSKMSLYDKKIAFLENKIQSLNNKLQACELYSRKNHFEFLLLRDIVEAVKLQNLQLISRINVYDQIVKDNPIYGSSCQRNQKVKTKQQKINKEHSDCEETSKLSQSQPFQSIQIQKSVICFNIDESIAIQRQRLGKYKTLCKKEDSKTCSTRQNQKNSTDILKQTVYDSKQQNILQSQLQRHFQLKSTQLKSLSKNQNCTVKTQKTKKILHFENITKKDLNSNNHGNQNLTQKIQKLFQTQKSNNIQKLSQTSICEENLLDSMQMIRQISKKNNEINNQNHIVKHTQNKKTNTQQKTKNLTKSQRARQAANNLQPLQFQVNQSKQIQAQYKQLLKVLKSLTKKQRALNQNDNQLPQTKAQIKREQNIIQAFQKTNCFQT